MKPARKVKVLLADDHAIVREGIRSSLVRFPHITVVGEAENGREAVAKSRKLSPDVVLMDLNMPEMSGLEATPLIRQDCPQTKVLALTVHDTKEYVFQLLRTGAHGYVLKDTSPEELVRAIESVSRGEAFFSPKISRIVLQDYVQSLDSAGARPQALLSSREREVLQYHRAGQHQQGGRQPAQSERAHRGNLPRSHQTQVEGAQCRRSHAARAAARADLRRHPPPCP